MTGMACAGHWCPYLVGVPNDGHLLGGLELRASNSECAREVRKAADDSSPRDRNLGGLP